MTRRRLNVKLLLVLLAGTVLIGGGVHLVHGLQEKRNAGALLKRADKAEKDGNGEEVEKYLSRYLAYNPADPDALSRYGLMLARRAATGRDRLRALFVLERALLYAPEREDVRRQAAELAMGPGIGRFKEAAEHLRRLLKAKRDDGYLELRLGQCHEALGRTGKQAEADREYRQARAFYEKSIAHAPNEVEAYVRLAGLLRGPLGDPDRADTVMDARELKDGLVAKNLQSFRAYLDRAGYRKQFGLPGAADDVARARQLAPDDAEVLLAAAESARGKGDLDAARTLYERGMKRHPKDMRFPESLATLEKRSGQYEKGLAVLRQGLVAAPDRADLQWGVADLLIETGKLDEAAEAIARLRKREDLRPGVLDFLEARVRANKGRWAEAIPLLEKARALLAGATGVAELTAQADLLLAQGYDRLGNPEQQLTASRRALAVDPRWPPALVEQAEALAELGRSDEAIDAYRQALPQVPAVAGPLARLLIARNVRKPAGERDWREVQTMLEQWEKADPDSVGAPVLWADFLVAKREAQAARERLEAARRKFPKRAELWTTLAFVAGRQGKPKDTLGVLDEAQRELGDLVELRIARAGFWAQQDGDQARKALEELAKDLDKFPLDDRLRLKDGLAAAFARRGDTQTAGRLWTEVAEQRPDDSRVAVYLYDLAVQGSNDPDQPVALERAIARLRAIEGDAGVLWRYGEASRLILQAERGDKKRLAEAHALLAEIIRRRPEWARVQLLEARIAELERNPERAITAYLKAIEGGERQSETIGRAVQLLRQNRRTAEADRLIQGLVAQAPPTGLVGRLAAEAAFRQGDDQGAVKRARQAVSVESRDFRDHLWLGQILQATKQPAKETEGEFHRAVELGENEPDAWLAWVSYLAGSDQKARAEQAIDEARRKLPAPGVSLVLARCYERIGARDKAEEEYRAALAARPDDPAVLGAVGNFYLGSGKSEQAQALFRKILDPRLKAPSGTVAAARRSLALCLSSSADAQAFLDAISLIDQNLRDEGGQLEDQRLKALMQASRPGRRREAIATFEDLGRQSPPSAEEKFLLAQLYLAVRDTAKARALLFGLAAEDSGNPRYLAALARVLLNRGEVEEAQPWVAKLEQAAPGSLSAVELRARLLQKEGKGPQAVAVLEARARSEPIEEGLVAALLEDLGEPAAADRLLREAVARSKNPQAVLVLARFLGRRGRAKEALDLCENAWKTCPAEAVSQTSLFVLDAAKADDVQRRRVAGALEEAIRKTPNNALLLFDLANLKIFSGDYPGAEALLRRIIALKPGSGGPLNNLAWLLANRGEKTDEALELVNQAIALEGSAPGLLDTRGLVYLALGRPQPALKDLTEAVAVNPTPVSIFHLARAQVLAARRDEARDTLSKAQTAGLEEKGLDPLEREAYRRLVATLSR